MRLPLLIMAIALVSYMVGLFDGHAGGVGCGPLSIDKPEYCERKP